MAPSPFDSKYRAAYRLDNMSRVLEEELLQAFDYQPETHNLGFQLSSFVDSGRFSDVTVCVEEEEINAHSVILAARSPVFEAMLSSNMQEKQQKKVVLRDLDPLAVRRMLSFMYTGVVDPKLHTENEATALLEVAHRYAITSLVDICVCMLSGWLTEENVADYLMLADHVGLDNFRHTCLAFITSSPSRVAEVQTTAAFSRLAERRPALAIDILAAVIPPAKCARTTDERAMHEFRDIMQDTTDWNDDYQWDPDFESAHEVDSLLAVEEQMLLELENEERQKNDLDLALEAEADSLLCWTQCQFHAHD